MKKVFPIFYLLLQSLSLTSFSQRRNIDFDHIGIADGLSQSNVQCIMQDSRGFMWFGTWEGLNKYDGYKMTVYKTKANDINSISNNFINSIIEDKSNDLWIATDEGGLCRFDRKTEKFVRYNHDPKNSNSVCSDIINTIIYDASGMLWIGTDAGLDKFDPQKNLFTHFTYDSNNPVSLSDNFVKYIFQDAEHDVWICTLNGGINLVNAKANNFTRYLHDVNNNNSLGINNIYKIFQDHDKRLWVGTNGAGLELFDKKTGIFKHFLHDQKNPNSLPANAVLAINEDIENNLWISTENGGLSVFNYLKGVFTTYINDEVDKESISNNSANTIYRDSKNNMWLGHFAGGVDIANRDKMTFPHFKHMGQSNSLSYNRVLSIFEDSKKNIWIGTDGGGLNLFDPIKNRFKYYKHLKNDQKSICGDYVLTTCEDSNGNIWIGTWANGITVINPAKNTFKHFKNEPGKAASLSSNDVWKIIKDRDNAIWVGTNGGGLDKLNSDGKSFTHYTADKKNSNTLNNNNVLTLYEDSDGDIWIGTGGGGLNCFNKKTKTFSYYLFNSAKNSISNNSINCISEDGDKNLLVGTWKGLNRFNKQTNLFTLFTSADGLPDNIVWGVIEDSKKNLWISTNKGITCFNPLTKLHKDFGMSDGLQSNEFIAGAYCKSSSGLMYFGGIGGFNQFYPDSIKTIHFDPPLVFTNFQIFNKDVAISADKNSSSPLRSSITETSVIALPYSNSVFSIEFATLNYIVSEKKKYAYTLEGFDKDWDEVDTKRTATYTHLDPATYVFKVKGLNNEGKWSDKILSIKLIITPPFWLTWWFKIGVIVTAFAVLLLFYRIRVKAIKAQRENLRMQVNIQTKQLLKSAQEEHNAREEADNARIETEQLNKELKIKNSELEQFVYVASHDLQEPLRTTTSFVELLHRQYSGKLDEKADKYLDFITDASKRMKNLITDLLEFSRIGRKSTLGEVDCNLVLEHVMADLQTAMLESGASVESTELPIIKGYPTEIKLLFQNLLINAIKFRKPDIPPLIKVSASKKAGNWQFAISDNGIGIDKQYSERIFEIFQRLHTRTEYGGSGIGLSHCKKIVELHQGEIWVESEPGKGSTFYFSLPENHIEKNKN